MSSWSKRRKSIYIIVISILVIVCIFVPLFLIFYKAPTCSDKIRNGNETGIDCGGSCPRICPDTFLPPSIAWARFEMVAPGVYNVASYIINRNIDVGAKNVPFHISLYDSEGTLITDNSGTMTLPPHRNTLAFQTYVNTGKRIPARALFEFKSIPNWQRQKDPLSKLIIKNKDYTESSGTSRLVATIENPSFSAIGKISVYAVLYDIDGNAIGFSRTIIDGIKPSSSVKAPFTWPIMRGTNKVISIEILPVAE